MKTSHATLLATTKFRTRLGRSILTVIAASLVAGIMVFGSFATSGIEDSLAKTRNVRLAAQHMVRESIFTPAPVKDSPPASAPSKDQAAPSVPSFDQFSSEAKAQGATQTYQEWSLGNYTLIDPPPPASTRHDSFGGDPSQSITARTDALYDILAGNDLPPVAEGTTPGLIEQSSLLRLAGVSADSSATAEQNVALIKTTLSTWRGKVLTFQQTAEDGSKSQLKITIQGFFGGSAFFGSPEIGSVLTPVSKTSLLTSVPSKAALGSDANYFAAFASEADQSAYVKMLNDSMGQGSDSQAFRYGEVYGDPLLSFKELGDRLQSLLTYLFLGLFAAVVIAMMTTVSKVISDSERETGVFRAIGARARDIVQIYAIYGLLITALSLVLATILALAVSLYLNHHFGPSLGVQVMSLTGNSTVDTRVSFLGFNLLQLLEIALAVALASLLGVLIPLWRLLRQDPVKALRSE